MHVVQLGSRNNENIFDDNNRICLIKTLLEFLRELQISSRNRLSRIKLIEVC